jgi:hypothetical protein
VDLHRNARLPQIADCAANNEKPAHAGGRFLPTCFETQTFTLIVPDSIAKSKNKPADLAGLFLEDCIHGWIATLHITTAPVSGWVAAEPLAQIVAGRYVLAPGVYSTPPFSSRAATQPFNQEPRAILFRRRAARLGQISDAGQSLLETMRTELHSLIGKLQTYLAQGGKADLQLGSVATLQERPDRENILER